MRMRTCAGGAARSATVTRRRVCLARSSIGNSPEPPRLETLATRRPESQVQTAMRTRAEWSGAGRSAVSPVRSRLPFPVTSSAPPRSRDRWSANGRRLRPRSPRVAPARSRGEPHGPNPGSTATARPQVISGASWPGTPVHRGSLKRHWRCARLRAPPAFACGASAGGDRDVGQPGLRGEHPGRVRSAPLEVAAARTSDAGGVNVLVQPSLGKAGVHHTR